MRRVIVGLAAALTCAILLPAQRASAQGVGNGVGTDVFSFYYGYYLPNAAFNAAQPKAMDTLNQITAIRQFNAQTDRTSLYDPISPYAEDEDQFDARSRNARGGRGGGRGSAEGRFGASMIRGAGPSQYYGRTSQYFPGMRSGRGPNRNLATLHGRSGGGMGMPSMGGMGMGPR